MTMQLISNRFIPAEEVRNLTTGSFEHLIARIEEAVRADALRMLGAKIETQVVGTFPGHVIVLAEDGRFLRVKYEDSKGAIKIVSHETVQVNSFTPDKMGGYLKNESAKAVESFLSGDVAGAVDRLKGLVRYVEKKDPTRDLRLVDAAVAFYRAERPWKKIFQEKADTIRRMMLDDVASIHEDRLQVKFRSLYDGSVSEADLEKYRELVIENLNKIGSRADRLMTQVSAALAEAKAKKLDDKNVEALLAFGEDLVEDLSATKKTVREIPSRVSHLDCLGKLHDSIAEDFRDRELAGRFVMKMSKRLGDANL